MEKYFITALLVLILLAPQSGLEAKSRHHGVKERDHDAEERDHEVKNHYQLEDSLDLRSTSDSRN